MISATGLSLLALFSLVESTLQTFEINGITFQGTPACNIAMNSADAYESLAALKSTGANYVQIPVTWYQDFKNSTEMHPHYAPICSSDDYRVMLTPKDAELEALIDHAHSIGLKVILSPRVDIAEGQFWNRGDIGTSFQLWHIKRWFRYYNRFMAHYQKIAQKKNVAIFSISYANCLKNIRKKAASKSAGLVGGVWYRNSTKSISIALVGRSIY